MEYFVYTRKSTETEEKQALSIPAQVRELKDYSVKEGLKIHEIIEETKSASKPNNRPLFAQMIERIKTGECQRILCWHTNRLSRNPMESGIIMQLLSDGKLLEILTPQKSITNENANDILLGVEFGANSQFSRELSSNTKRGLREKVLRGEYPTFAPPFYLNVGTQKGRKNIVPDSSNYIYYEKLVDKIISERMRSDNAYKVLMEWGVKSKKGKYYSRNTVNRLLRNHVYYGGLEFHGMEEQTGKWEPLISKAKWLQLQEVLDKKSKPYQTKHNLPFRKLIVCGECGYTVVPYTKTKNSGKAYSYYSCSKRGGHCTNPTIKKDDLENQILENLSKITFDEDTLDYLKKESIRKLSEEMEFEFKKRDEVEKEYKDINIKINKLLEMRLSDELSQEEYISAKETFTKRLEALEELRSGFNYNRKDMQKQLELFFDSCFNMKNLFINGTPEERTQLVYMISENLELNEGKLRWNFKEPWKQMISLDIHDEKMIWGG